MSDDREVSTGQVLLIIGFILMCAGVLVVGGIMNLVESRQNKQLPGVAELEAGLGDYAQAGVDALAASSQPATETPIGKVVPVDWTDAEAPKLDFDILKLLPKANRPVTADQVETIALMRYFKKEFTEYYDAGEPGWAQACEITLVDAATGTLIDSGEVAGEPPAMMVEGQRSVGPLSDDAVLAFVLRTPTD